MELKKVFCENLEEIPSIKFIKKELDKIDRIRLDYLTNSEIKNSKEIIKLVNEIKSNLNVVIDKGELKDLEFYNIYNLFSVEELDRIYLKVEKAAKTYRLISESLIKEFEGKYDYKFQGATRGSGINSELFKLDENRLNQNWKYYFHGGDICFENLNTKQIVDINLKYGKYYGVLDLWFFQSFLRTTKEFKNLSEKFENNSAKLVQVINFLKINNKLDIINSPFKDIGLKDKLIWNK